MYKLQLCFVGLLLLASSLTDATSNNNVVDVEPSHGRTVAIIGCGPSGMFFLHALAEKRRILEANYDAEGLTKLPQVEVFEKSSSCGGIWRSDQNRRQINSNSTNMYDDLWTKSFKEGMEFFDYTYNDHFDSKPKPAYLRRQEVLDYMMARVHLHGDIFEDVVFNTAVRNVEYNHTAQNFIVKTQHAKRKGFHLQTFHKVIWAGGMNGTPNMVPEIMNKLTNFTGQIIHSSDIDKFTSPQHQNSLQGKRILMIGDRSSAEDLAFQSIKFGADKIYITSRHQIGSASYTGAWPFNKVKNLFYSQVSGVKKGRTISFERTGPGWPEQDDVEDIDLIIFCTGYKPNTDMLAESLRPRSETQDETLPIEELGINPKPWKMKFNYFGKILGHVEPSSQIKADSMYLPRKTYRRRMHIDNPNMMYIFEVTSQPLLEIDVAARACLSYIIGETPIPSREERIESNRNDLIASMNEVHIRLTLDSNYRKAHLKSHMVGDDMSAHSKSLVKRSIMKRIFYDLRLLANDMNQAKYPLRLGDMQTLGLTGTKLKAMRIMEEFTKVDLGRGDMGDEWKTYRDMSPKYFSSLFTGVESSPLNGRWMDLDDAEGNNPFPVTENPWEVQASEEYAIDVKALEIMLASEATWNESDHSGLRRSLIGGWDEPIGACSFGGDQIQSECKWVM